MLQTLILPEEHIRSGANVQMQEEGREGHTPDGPAPMSQSASCNRVAAGITENFVTVCEHGKATKEVHYLT